MRAHFLLLLTAVASLAAAGPDWPHYGGGPEQTRYSTLTQITPANVGSLKVAWTYDTQDAFKGSEMQCQPVVAHGVLYATSPKLRVFALNAATGAPLWSFDTSQDAKTLSRTRIRGLMYWERGEDRRIYFASRHWLYALDAKTGKPLPQFGQDGRIDCVRVSRAAIRARSASASTPWCLLPRSADPGFDRARRPAVGARRHSRLRHQHRPAEVGVPHHPHPGEPGYDTWPADAWKYSRRRQRAGRVCRSTRRAVSSTRRPARHRHDFYGANRLGDNLFANTILCLRAATGERVWHFQGVKHDVWDRDFPASPSLITIRHDGRQRDVVTQTAKNGTAVRPRSRHRAAALSDGASPAPAVRRLKAKSSRRRRCCRRCRRPSHAQRFTEDLITNAHAGGRRRRCAQEWLKLRKGGEFDPPSTQGTILFPGMDGGGEWGGDGLRPEARASSMSMRTRWRGRSSWPSARCPMGSRRQARPRTSGTARRATAPT